MISTGLHLRSLTGYAETKSKDDNPFMEEIAFIMQLKPGMEAEYERRHDAIWPELAAALTAAGVRDYSIFLDRRTGTLFAVQKRVEGHTADRLPTLPIVQTWWAYMADLMETNPDNSPVVKPLERVFHLP